MGINLILGKAKENREQGTYAKPRYLLLSKTVFST
jgi:hypothetical protein